MFSDSNGYQVYQYQQAGCKGPSTPLSFFPIKSCDAGLNWQEFYYYVDGNKDLHAKMTTQCVGNAPNGQPPNPKTGPKSSPSKTAPKSFRAA